MNLHLEAQTPPLTLPLPAGVVKLKQFGEGGGLQLELGGFEFGDMKEEAETVDLFGAFAIDVFEVMSRSRIQFRPPQQQPRQRPNCC